MFVVRNAKNLLSIAVAGILLAWWVGIISSDGIDHAWQRMWELAFRIPLRVWLAILIGGPAIWYWINRAYTLRGSSRLPSARVWPFGRRGVDRGDRLR